MSSPNLSQTVSAFLQPSQAQPDTKTTSQLAAKTSLSEARSKLKLEHAEEAKGVVDPEATKPPRLTARQRAKYAKLTPAEDILTAISAHRWVYATTSEAYLRYPEYPLEEPFYPQLEEIRRIEAQFSLLARCSHAQVNPQARR